jgi:hypothetical protein
MSRPLQAQIGDACCGTDTGEKPRRTNRAHPDAAPRRRPSACTVKCHGRTRQTVLRVAEQGPPTQAFQIKTTSGRCDRERARRLRWLAPATPSGQSIGNRRSERCRRQGK